MVRLTALLTLMALWPAGAAAQTFKVAFWNLRSGYGVHALGGRTLFVAGSDCTTNAWGSGAMKGELNVRVRDDPAVIALGVAESWNCATPPNVQAHLGWAARSRAKNGLALIVRYGFAPGSQDAWQELTIDPDTHIPHDTHWVLHRPMCVDAPCSRAVDVFVTHWGNAHFAEIFEMQASETVAFMQRMAGNRPQILLADLNQWDDGIDCGIPTYAAGLQQLRDAGYTDAWATLRAGHEGYTGMINRNGCGIPPGNTFKRIDYVWSRNMTPLAVGRFGLPDVIGDTGISDHYGVKAKVAFGAGGIAPDEDPLGTGEILRYAAAAPVVRGHWRAVADESAAGGRRLKSPNTGAAKITTPRADPGNYFELTVDVEAGRRYRLWLRARADNDSFANDSVYVQFTNTVDAEGRPAYRIGTGSAMAFALQGCRRCPISGWGWEDTGWGGLGPEVRFATRGRQTLRIQTREDGLSIDQIMLSPERFLLSPPGSRTDDSTTYPQTP